jgi:predicted acylesterase/phospholipase RssA
MLDIVYAYGFIVVAAFVVLAVREAAPVLLPMLGYAAWLGLADSPHVWMDVALGGSLVLLLSWHFYRPSGVQLWGNSRLSSLVFGTVSTLSVWLLLSFADTIASGSPILVDGAAYRKARAESPWAGLNVGIALSGGGYRAALFHAGVVDALEELGAPPTHISSVSGGSIIASYYSLGGRPKRFRDAVAEGRFGLARRATSAFEVTRMLCPGKVPGFNLKLLPFCEYGRSDVQAQLLDDVLLKKATFEQTRGSGLPELVIAGTDLDDGGPIGLTGEGILRIRPTPIELKFPFKNGPPVAFSSISFSGTDLNEVHLSRAVAASGAFPLALDSVHMEISDQTLRVVDGGVADNSSLNVLVGADSILRWRLRLVLVSDGSRALERHTSAQPNSVLGEVTRALDILSSAGSLPRDLAEFLSAPLFLLSPNSLLRFRDVPEDFEEKCAEHWKRAMEFSMKDQRIARVLDSWQFERELATQAAHGDVRRVPHHGKAGIGSLLRALEMFLKAPTLKDTYSELEAFQLYQLGRYMTAFHWRTIRESLDSVQVHARGEVR